MSMYIFCLIFALIRTEETQAAFRMALAATIAIPIVLYGCLLFTKVVKPKEREGAPEEPGEALTEDELEEAAVSSGKENES